MRGQVTSTEDRIFYFFSDHRRRTLLMRGHVTSTDHRLSRRLRKANIKSSSPLKKRAAAYQVGELAALANAPAGLKLQSSPD
jgi:hypothetical protein